MPLKLTRKQGSETTLTFPGDLKAVVRTNGVQQVVVSIDDGLESKVTKIGIVVFTQDDQWPVCIIDFDGCNKWGQPVFAFDAPPEVKIHRDDIKEKK